MKTMFLVIVLILIIPAGLKSEDKEVFILNSSLGYYIPEEHSSIYESGYGLKERICCFFFDRTNFNFGIGFIFYCDHVDEEQYDNSFYSIKDSYKDLSFSIGVQQYVNKKYKDEFSFYYGVDLLYTIIYKNWEKNKTENQVSEYKEGSASSTLKCISMHLGLSFPLGKDLLLDFKGQILLGFPSEKASDDNSQRAIYNSFMNFALSAGVSYIL